MNVILYTIDCLRHDKLSNRLTPNTVDVCNVFFKNAFTVSGYTGYSTGSLHTGCYPHHHGYDYMNRVLKDDVSTLAEKLSRKGYKAQAYVGVDSIIGGKQGLDRGFDEHVYMGDWVQSAVDYIKKADDDFFLWGHYFDVHNVFNKEAHDFRIREMDERLIKKTVEVLGDRLDETLLIVTADHGEALGSHGFQGHDSPYDEVMRIPLAWHIPNMGSRVEEKLVRNIDTAPTILGLLGEDVDNCVDGRPMLPETPSDNEVYFYNIYADKSKGYKIIRDVDWKLIEFFYKNRESRYELYHVSVDSSEEDNLVDDMPRVFSEYKEKLESYSGGVDDVVEVGGGDEEEIKKRLRSLGYL